MRRQWEGIPIASLKNNAALSSLGIRANLPFFKCFTANLVPVNNDLNNFSLELKGTKLLLPFLIFEDF